MPSVISAISCDRASDNGTPDDGASDDGASDKAASDDDSASESSRSSSEGDEDHSETRVVAENVMKEAATLINEASDVDMEALCDICITKSPKQVPLISKCWKKLLNVPFTDNWHR